MKMRGWISTNLEAVFGLSDLKQIVGLKHLFRCFKNASQRDGLSCLPKLKQRYGGLHT